MRVIQNDSFKVLTVTILRNLIQSNIMYHSNVCIHIRYYVLTYIMYVFKFNVGKCGAWKWKIVDSRDLDGSESEPSKSRLLATR